MGIGMLLSGALGYIETVAMTHMVSPNAYGVFVLVLTSVTLISQLSKLGLDAVLLRFLPTYRAKQQWSLVAGLITFTLWIPTVVGSICAILLFLFASTLARSVFHSGAYTIPFREIALLIPLTGLQGVLINGLCAVKSIKWQVYVGKVIEPCATLTLLVVFYLIGFRLEALILAYIFGTLASVVLGWIAFRRLTRGLVHNVTPYYAPSTWMRFGSAMLFNVMTIAVVQSTDVLGLGAFASPGQVSLYGVADRVGALIAMPFFALNVIFSPMIAELHARHDHRQLRGMFALVTRWSFSLSWPICLCCVVFARPILSVFGHSYVAGAPALIIVAVGNMLNAGTGPVGSMLAMAGRLRILWVNTVIRIIVNLALIFLLIPRYTILGAAVASSLTLVILNIVALIEVWRMMRLQPYRREMLKPLVAGALAAAVGWLLLRLGHFNSDIRAAALLHTSALLLAFAIVYVLALAWMGLDPEDLKVFGAVRARLRRG